MRLKVLGAYGASDAEHNLTGYLLDDWFAVDAGTLTSKLSFAQQSRVLGVFITHPHADHIRDLPHLILTLRPESDTLVFFALREGWTARPRWSYGVILPDFSSRQPATGRPSWPIVVVPE